jgi:Tol biopolymer transport system component/tetratricopeptide (TPR) repeat protein
MSAQGGRHEGTETTVKKRWREIFEIADTVLDLDPEARPEFIERCIEQRPEIGHELRALIEGADAAISLDTPASAFAAPFALDADFQLDVAADAGQPVQFGPYRVLREIGSGGMGAVYLAERSDDQYQKEVALKVLPRWRGDSRRRRWFLEERQILATLDHPGIARLLDGGVTADGLPWFAMEYVNGTQIDRYCEERRLPVRRRLELFCEVCSAVQHAHRSLVVHRDLKPSNILVSADGKAKLLDFGIARLVQEQTADGAHATTGNLLMTPLYASPEQIRGEPPSTSADVYALGVLLHRLLSGSNPYRLSSFDNYEVVRAVLEEDPVKPSDLVDSRLAGRLRGDLDAIVLKAIAKEPARRYATVEQMETDVRRHLDGLPVLARPESRTYLLRKFVQRHRLGVGMATAAATLIVGFAGVMTVQRSRIRAQAERITRERDRAEQVGQNFMKLFQSVTPGDNGITARDILDSATARIDEQLKEHPEQRARLMFEMARAYHRLDMNDRASGLVDGALSVRRALRPANDLELAEVLDLSGAVLFAQRKLERARVSYDEALVLRRSALARSDPLIARTLVGLSGVLRDQNRLSEAEALSREALAIDRARAGTAGSDLAQSTTSLAKVINRQGDHARAAALMEQSLSLTRRAHVEEHPAVAAAILDLAGVLNDARQHRRADSLIRYALGIQTRMLAADRMRGMATHSVLPVARATDDVTAPIESVFRDDSTASARVIPASNGDNSLIVFGTDRDGPDPIGNHGNEEIYVMNRDGSGQRRLTNHPAADNTPAFSPDGSQIAFMSQRVGGFDIFVMNADGTGQRRLTNFTEIGLGAVNPEWSPDGKRIVFRSRVGPMNLYVINIDGTGLRKLTDDPLGAVQPSWSPDGRKIAFASLRHGRHEIYVMNTDGTDQVRLTFNTAQDNRPAWSPDSRRIAFHSGRDGNLEIYIMNADGSDQRRLTTHPTDDTYPSFSPDGNRIVFMRVVLGHGQVFSMNADGSDVVRLTEISPVAFSGFPDWGPAQQR